MVILRNTNTNLLVDSSIIHEPDLINQFINVEFGNYQIEAYDAANGLNTVIPPNTTEPTTSSTTLPTTIQTTNSNI